MLKYYLIKFLTVTVIENEYDIVYKDTMVSIIYYTWHVVCNPVISYYKLSLSWSEMLGLKGKRIR